MTSFAVVITNYNYRPYVVEAVDSALAQTHAPVQVLVVDDGSTDGSRDLLSERYGQDSRVSLLYGENGGQLVGFQRGVAQAQADVVAFLDADDRWEPRYLEQLAALYGARKDVDFVFSDLQVFGDHSERMLFEDASTPVDLGFTAISTYILQPWYGAPTSALSMRLRWAQDTLDLPASFGKAWRLCADACLVHGASILGARKYYLPTGCVGYRSHGKNGWYATRRDPVSLYRNRMRNHGIIRHYAQRAGMDASCVDHSKYEYRTKPAPSKQERKRYATLALRGESPWWKRYERALGIWAGRRRGRKPE